ncbi:hypothetical protein PYH37_004125 [Sinorhizobium numidicum]|uniref:Transmembrane protein n=1 Tax=Sinorhizobium numidicum TaxID=680248 RepID=A0ABY8CV59_9HYPH|nr:hypothetical protein [Sinorhizobium numidicum]WEX75874.1 hypothetical protein PYH37_004125 [Sinorhizobium numidicum]WEX82533.1 hypothetical protein PYH38_004837 [Sinorhizobium numidicum]
MVLLIFIAALGLVIGLAALFLGMELGKPLAICSSALMVGIIWLSDWFRSETLDRFLLGRERQD